jgi:signal transduction histidine kinase
LISSLKHWVSNWFKETTIWWFTTLFGRIGVLFSIAAFVLVLVTYYVVNWGYTGRDDILDAHDAYHYNSLVSSWGSPPDISILERELNNLKLKCSIFIADNDTICANDTLIYWSNHIKDLSLCNYLSYGSTEDYFETHGIHYSNYVSFGDLEFDQDIVQATFVQQDTFKYLITLDIPPTQPPTFFPFIILALLSLSTLYLITRRFLQPISLIEKRIVALEAGDLDSTLPVVGKDELAVLSKNFNTMVKEIKNLLKQKERLLSDVSHELRTPLAKIRLLLAMIKPEDQKNKDTKSKIKRIDKQIKVLDSLITNILLSDQMSAAYSNLGKKPTTINELINQALELTFVEKEDIHIKTNINPPLLVDSVKMSIAIKNLIENAYKYADDNEKITLHVSEDSESVNFLVKDRGPGIPENLIKDITKAFVRGKNQAEAGFGLGLSICYKVISAHGGKLLIKNNPKGGASFTLCIPKEK